jgi:hypothetical protein
LIGVARVTETPVPLLVRRFPGGESPAFPRVVVCGETPPTPPLEAWLEPGHLSLAVLPGALGDAAFGDCLTLEVESDVAEGAYALPASLGGVSIDPTPLLVGPVEPSSPATCSEDESEFLDGCVRVLDDRAMVRAPEAATLWTLKTGVTALLATPEPGGSFLLPGLAPNTSHSLAVGLLDTAGQQQHADIDIVTGAPRPHIVINEVLANPLGAEPAQEWIEIYNDGASAVELAGFVLSDSAGPSTLPAHLLAPGAFVILAREDFAKDDGSDVPIPAGVTVLGLGTLGKNGLTNSGERLELRTPLGELTSVFPAAPKPKPGISVARRAPSALDSDASSFAYHDSPGASPGAANQTLP